MTVRVPPSRLQTRTQPNPLNSMKTSFALPGILTLLLLTGLVAAAQTYPDANSTVVMKLEGEKSGVMRGEIVQKGREGFHRLLAYSHEIVSPRDPATGQATGKRQHQPFRIVKYLNQSSPLLLTALANNERLKTVTIDIWGIDRAGTGVERKLLTYVLTGATIISLRPWMPNKSDTSAASYPPAEEIAFVYQSIEVTWTDGGIVGQDSWNPLAQ